jgi:hypothetical protein
MIFLTANMYTRPEWLRWLRTVFWIYEWCFCFLFKYEFVYSPLRFWYMQSRRIQSVYNIEEDIFCAIVYIIWRKLQRYSSKNEVRSKLSAHHVITKSFIAVIQLSVKNMETVLGANERRIMKSRRLVMHLSSFLGHRDMQLMSAERKKGSEFISLLTLTA